MHSSLVMGEVGNKETWWNMKESQGRDGKKGIEKQIEKNNQWKIPREVLRDFFDHEVLKKKTYGILQRFLLFFWFRCLGKFNASFTNLPVPWKQGHVRREKHRNNPSGEHKKIISSRKKIFWVSRDFPGASLVGGWVSTSLKNMRVRQMGSWNPRDRGKKFKTCLKPKFHLSYFAGWLIGILISWFTK